MIGINGAIKHGKTTLAEAFEQAEPNSLHLESSSLIGEVLAGLNESLAKKEATSNLDFINAGLTELSPVLKRVVRIDFDAENLCITDEDLMTDDGSLENLLNYANNVRRYPSLLDGHITPENKSLIRPGLQGLGHLLVCRVSDDVWYTELLRRATSPEYADKQLIVFGGLRYPADADVIKKAGGMIIEVIRPNTPEADTSDPTERQRSFIENDVLVYNDASLEQLNSLAKMLLRDIIDKSFTQKYYPQRYYASSY